MAAYKIIEEFSKRSRADSEKLTALSITEIKAIARELLTESNEDVKFKYAEE